LKGKDIILFARWGRKARWTIVPSATRPAKRSKTKNCHHEIPTARRAAPGAVRRAWFVAKHQMELEAEFREDAEVYKYHFHPRCFMAWEFERSRDGASGQERLELA
jgi:hypothetical protein